MRFWFVTDSTNYCLSGLVYHNGVRYWVWISDERGQGCVYIAVPISCKEFKQVMRGIITCRDVLDKHPLYRLHTQYLMSDEHDEPILHAERLVNGLRDVGELNQPTADAYMRYIPELNHPDFYK